MTSPRLDCAVASAHTGAVLQALSDESAAPLLRELAGTLPELFDSVESSCLERVATSLDPGASASAFIEVLLLSDSHVHVLQPLPERPGEVLLASAPAGRSVGLVLSQVHERAATLGKRT